MLINEMSENDCRALLARASLAHLGCSLDAQPYVIPIYIAYDSSFIYSFSTLGQKIEWMRANPRVCVQVDDITSQTNWSSVIALGHFQELPEPQFADEAALARKLCAQRHSWWLNALAERQLKVRGQFIDPLFFRIRVDSLSGLRTAH